MKAAHEQRKLRDLLVWGLDSIINETNKSELKLDEYGMVIKARSPRKTLRAVAPVSKGPDARKP